MDYWVSYIAYFFDINYPKTSEIILENHYVERIIQRIPYGSRETEQKMWALHDLVIDYLEKLAGAKQNIYENKRLGDIL